MLSVSGVIHADSSTSARHVRKSAEQLEWPVRTDPSPPSLLLPRPPATVSPLMIAPLLTPVGAQAKPVVCTSRDGLITTLRLLLKWGLIQH